MTVIVGVCNGDRVWMGADSLASSNSYAIAMKQPKIVRRSVNQVSGSRELLIGASGNHRPHFLISQMQLPDHEYGLDALGYVADRFVDSLRTLYQMKGYLQKQAEREAGNCSLLVGYQGRLFAMWDEFDVVEVVGYMAIGSGMEFALGALAATENSEPENRVQMALEAAEKHNPYVRRPFQIEQI